MISMFDGISIFGKQCPKCENNSVFLKENLYVEGLIFKTHKYNLYKCEMDDCDFKEILTIEEAKLKKWI